MIVRVLNVYSYEGESWIDRQGKYDSCGEKWPVVYFLSNKLTDHTNWPYIMLENRASSTQAGDCYSSVSADTTLSQPQARDGRHLYSFITCHEI